MLHINLESTNSLRDVYRAWDYIHECVSFFTSHYLYFTGSDTESAAVTPARQTRRGTKEPAANVDKPGNFYFTPHIVIKILYNTSRIPREFECGTTSIETLTLLFNTLTANFKNIL